jgi:hypothetical protein
VKVDATQLVIFATSDSASPIRDVAFNLASLVTPSTSSVTDYSENRTLNLNSLRFTDTFEPYDAHAYIIKG